MRSPRAIPQSGAWRLRASVSRKNRSAVVSEMRKMMAPMMFGSAKGYAWRNRLPPNSPGNRSAGFAKSPPNAGPKIDPIDHTSGIMEKARG